MRNNFWEHQNITTCSITKIDKNAIELWGNIA